MRFNLNLIEESFFYLFSALFNGLHAIESAKLDAPSDANAIILEDPKLVQKIQIFLVKTDAST